MRRIDRCRNKWTAIVVMLVLLCSVVCSSAWSRYPSFIVEEPEYPYTGAEECLNDGWRQQPLNTCARRLASTLWRWGWNGAYYRNYAEIEHTMDSSWVVGHGEDEEYDDNFDLAVIHTHGGLHDHLVEIAWNKYNPLKTGRCTARVSGRGETLFDIALGLANRGDDPGRASNVILMSCCTLNVEVTADNFLATIDGMGIINHGVSQIFGMHGTFQSVWSDGYLEQFFLDTQGIPNYLAWLDNLLLAGEGYYDGYNSPNVVTLGATGKEALDRQDDAYLACGFYLLDQGGPKSAFAMAYWDNGCYGCCNETYCGPNACP